MKNLIGSHKQALIACFTFVLLFGAQGLRAQSWTESGITAEGDSITYRFPPPDSTYIHNLLVLKFYNGGLYTDSLCYDCDEIVEPRTHEKGAKPQNDDPYGYFSTCKETLLRQQFTLGIIQDPTIRSILMSNGASYIMRMTAANPCTDTLSVTRRPGDTIPSDDYNWVEVTFDNNTGLIPAIEELFALNPQSLQLEDLVHLMHPAFIHKPRNPNDSEFQVGNQKSLKIIGMPMAWSYDVGENAIKVAVVDNGVDWRRCELGGISPESGNVKVTGGWDFNTMTVDGVDSVTGMTQGHGTGIASIIAALTNNDSCVPRAIAGFAYGMAGEAGGWGTFDDDTSTGGTGAQILAYKIDPLEIDSTLYYRSDWAASAILEASANSPNGPYGFGAHIINNSYGYDSTDTAIYNIAKDVFPGLRAAAADAYRQGVCFVAAKGNNDGSSDGDANWPADFSPQKDIIAVGACSDTLVREEYSTYGRTTDLIAPGGVMGGDLLPGNPDNISRAQNYGAETFHYFEGTSAAAPHVCGVLALMRGFYSGSVQPFTEDWEGMLEASAQSLTGLADPDSIPPIPLTAYVYPSQYDLRVGWGLLRADSILELLDPAGPLHYQLFHYSVPFADCDSTAWTDSTALNLEDDGFSGSLKAGPYPAFRRDITGSMNYSSTIDTTKQVYAWGNGGDGVGIGGWTIASPNSQEPWSEVINGLGGISGSPVKAREGIWHNQTRTVMAHSFQYNILVHGTYVHYPPDSLCGVSFTVFGSSAPVSSVASHPRK